MPGSVSAYQQGTLTTPVDGDPGSAAVVLSNDNAVATKHNSHDADATIHVQSSALAGRPAAGTAQRFWVTTDGRRLYLDNGASWDEVAYLPSVGGTVTGASTFSAGAKSGNGSVSAPTATATTLFTPSIEGMYHVSAWVASGGASLMVWAVVVFDGTTPVVLTQAGTPSLTIGAGAVKVIQSSGITQTVKFTYTLAQGS